VAAGESGSTRPFDTVEKEARAVPVEQVPSSNCQQGGFEGTMTTRHQDHDGRDQQWARKIREGDRAAFEALFHAYYGSLCDFAWQYVRSEDIVEELVQDIFLYVWERRADWLPQGTVRSYLYRAVYNKSLNHLKHRRIEKQWEVQHREDEPSETPEDALSFKELSDAIQASLDALPERRRHVFLLSRQHNMTYAEIAEMLGISIKTVETQMGRALQSMRERLAAFLSLVQ
jgi:RNA polymerase sigma-70 factor (ECF subfamily)